MVHAIDKAAVGVEVSWSFGNGAADDVRLSRAAVDQLFREHGFGHCAPECVLEVNDCLRRARGVARNRPWLVTRELARPNKDVAIALAVYVRDDNQTVGETGDGWRMVGRVRYSDTHDKVLAYPPEGIRPDQLPQDSRTLAGIAEAKRLAEFAQLLRETAVNSDVSAALVQACHTARCVPRRPGGGGVYLVFAGPACGALVALLEGLEAHTADNLTSHRFRAQVQETYPAPLTSRSWAQSAEDHLQAHVDRLLGDLEELVSAGTMRERTREMRAKEADELVSLAERCEVFLADRTEVLRATLAKVAEAFRCSIEENLAEAEKLLADLPDPERTAKAAEKAQERTAKKNGTKPAQVQP